MGAFEDRITFVEPLTLLDFPGKVGAIFFYNYCNAHCPYCYNKDVVEGKMSTVNADFVTSFLNKRKGKIDGIVFSGGECTVHKAKLVEDIATVKDMGFMTKLDTNGTNFQIVEQLVNEGFVDYIALDFKCPVSKISKFFPRTAYYDQFQKTLKFLIDKNFPFEVRTTVHTDVIDENDINAIIDCLTEQGYKNVYYIQHYFDVEETLGNVSHNPRPLDKSKLSDKLKIEFRNE